MHATHLADLPPSPPALAGGHGTVANCEPRPGAALWTVNQLNAAIIDVLAEQVAVVQYTCWLSHGLLVATAAAMRDCKRQEKVGNCSSHQSATHDVVRGEPANSAERDTVIAILSVHLSVCPSHSDVVPERLNLSSK